MTDRIKEINDSIAKLKNERKQLEKQELENKKIVKQKELNELDSQINSITYKIEEIQQEISIKNTEITLLNKKSIELSKERRQLKKKRCNYVGHDWDYDFETHNQGGPLEEICSICGTNRDFYEMNNKDDI